MTRRSTVLIVGLLATVPAGGCAGPSPAPAAEEAAWGTATEAEAVAAHHVAWTYVGDGSPEHWGTLDEQFAACSTGGHQSPIDVGTAEPADLPPLVFDYRAGAGRVVNNGHTVQVSVDSGSVLRVGDDVYRLIQFHHHAPGEHQARGVAAPLEMHLVHRSAAGDLAVVGVLFDAGAPNTVIAALLAADADDAGDEADMGAAPLALLPVSRSGYVTYEGSLTTPPCAEGVRWIVLDGRGQASAEQIAALAATPGPNARPLQPAGARRVLRSRE